MIPFLKIRNSGRTAVRSFSTIDWHKYETGQVLIVVSGKANYQERGKDTVVLTEGAGFEIILKILIPHF